MMIRHTAAAVLLGLTCVAASAQQGSGPAPATPPGTATPAMPPSGVSATQSATQTPATTTDKAASTKRDRRTRDGQKPAASAGSKAQ